MEITGAAAGPASRDAAGVSEYTDNTEAREPTRQDRAVDPAGMHAVLGDALAAHLSGMALRVTAAGVLNVAFGSLWMPTARRVLPLNAPLSVTPSGLLASTWYPVYVFESAPGVLALEVGAAITEGPVDPTTPGFANPSGFLLRGTAKVKGSASAPDFTRRFLGWIRTSSAGAPYPYRSNAGPAGWVWWLPAGNTRWDAAPFRVLGGGTALALTAVSCAAVVSPTSILCFAKRSTGSNGVVWGNPDDGELVFDAAAGLQIESPWPLDSQRRMAYRVATNGSGFFDIRGYWEER